MCGFANLFNLCEGNRLQFSCKSAASKENYKEKGSELNNSNCRIQKRIRSDMSIYVVKKNVIL